MNKFWLVGASALALTAASPAMATLQIAADFGGATLFCADNQVCDLNPATGVLQLGNVSLGGVTVNGSVQASSITPDFLNTSSLSAINTTGASIAYQVTVGDTNFAVPVSEISFSGSGTWQTAVGSTSLMRWFADPTNTQGANTAGDVPGLIQGAFANVATTSADAFSTSGSNPFGALSPFSMTEDISGSIVGGGSLINHGQTMIATGGVIPEPSTWAMGVIGFGLMGVFGWRKRKASRTLFA